MSLKRDVEEIVVLRILGILLGPKASITVVPSANGAQATVPLPSVIGNVGEAPREYLDRSGAKTNPAKITALGLYLRAQGTESFAARSVRDLFVAAGEPAPRNLPRDVKEAIRLGWLAPRPDQLDSYYVTNRGESAASSGFTERATKPRRPNRTRSGGVGDSEENSPSQRATGSGIGATQVLGELLEQGYFRQPRTYHDIVRVASERGHTIRRTDLTQPLLSLVQERPPRLTRQKVTTAGSHQPVWAYSAPTGTEARRPH